MRFLNLFKRRQGESPAPSLDGVNVHLSEIEGAIEIVDHFPRVNWAIVRKAVTQYQQHPAINRLWTELGAQWLVLIGKDLGEHYKLYESDHLLLMSGQPNVTRTLATIGDAAYIRLERIIGRLAADRELGKHAVVVFDTMEAYFDYVSYFHPDREGAYGMSAGMHIGRGYGHTILNGKLQTIDRTLVHELAHHMVSHRSLPLWLNEGIAQFVEDLVPGYRSPLVDHRQVRLHRRYWTWFGINHFWAGHSFKSVPSQRLSYQLSDILFRNLVSHPLRRKRLHEFIATAHPGDAGATACMECFGCPLAALVEEFLGRGEWGYAPAERS